MDASNTEAEVTRDAWSDWLLEHRHGGDPAFGADMRAAIGEYRDRVLRGARLREGTVLLDAGAGDGLIAFAAIDQVGPSLQVILTDVSPPLLRHCQAVADARGVRSQCRFVQGSVEHLAGVADATVDVVTTRAVLAFAADKRAALGEFHRVLRPGGRLSICEPICQDYAFEVMAMGQLIQARPDHPDVPCLKLLHRVRSAQFPATEADIARNPLTNYSDRDLVQFAHAAGFTRIHMELHIDHAPTMLTDWDVFLRTSAHPWSPTVATILAERFSPADRDEFERVVRPTIESGGSLKSEAIAYLTADKPPA